MAFKYDKDFLVWVSENADTLDEALENPKLLPQLFIEFWHTVSVNDRGQLAYFLYDQVEVNLFDIIKDSTDPEEFSYIFINTPISSIELPAGLKVIPYNAFCKCSDLKDINLPNSVKIIGNSSFRESAIKEVIIPPGVKSINELAFSNCTNLQSVKLNEGLKSIEMGAFWGCKSLKKIVIPKSVEKFDSLVFNDSSLQEITFLGSENLSLYSSLSQMFHQCPNLTHITLPDTWTYIGYDMFAGSGLKEFTCPKSCKEIKPAAFMNCPNLEKVIINDGCEIIRQEAFLDTDNFLLELPQSIKAIDKNAIGNSSGNRSKNNNTKIKVRGLSKEQAKEFFETKVKFESAAIKSRCIKALV